VRLRVQRLDLAGTTRAVEFRPGLNVIVGPISTGKSSLMRLLRVALGGEYSGISPEVDANVVELAAQLVIGDAGYSVRRRLVTTPTASVEVAGQDEAAEFPALRPSPGSRLTYGDWLLDKLNLPRLEVPSAPTRPGESTTVRVTINDYLRYCRITQEEIDVDVLGSSQWFKDNKRRVVFRILYGGFDTDVAMLQQRLREVQTELRALQGDTSAFARFLAGTPFANRAALDEEHARAVQRRDELHAAAQATVAEAAHVPEAQALRRQVVDADARVAGLRAEAARERRSAEEHLQLRNQLQTQAGRLTRAIVAGDAFFDFEFRVCPRCGNSVDAHRATDGTCYLCVQQEPEARSRDDLVREQARIGVQIAETEQLVASHELRAADLEAAAAAEADQRAAVGARLNQVLETFVNDRAAQTAERAAAQAAAEADIARLTDYLSVFTKYDTERARIDELEAESQAITSELEQAERLDSTAEQRISDLQDRFAFFVEEIGIPEFAGHPRAAIDRSDYQPIVNGRKLDGHSAGVRVLINVAHLLAHHVAAADLGLPLPGILLIDGITKNIGTAEYDAERINNVWNQLLHLDSVMGDDLQIIVAANNIPENVTPHVVLELSEQDRLIPEISDATE
jgi:hypothetical protein